MFWNVRCRLTVGEKQFGEFDLTPALGVGFAVIIFLLVGRTTMGV
jgi:hypothetical protein